MSARQTSVPVGDGAQQPGQLQLPGTPVQSKETLITPVVTASGGAAAPESEEKDPTLEATEGTRARQAARGRPAMGRRPMRSGRDVFFSSLKLSAGEPAQSGAEAQPGERRKSLGAARSGCPVQALAATSAREGPGVSVLLLHLAWAPGYADRRVAMMDLDPTGGLDFLCGQNVPTGLRRVGLLVEESAFQSGHLVGVLPIWHTMPILIGDARGGPLPCVEVVLEAMRVEYDVALVDLPRRASLPLGVGVFILTGLDSRSAVAAESIASRLWGMAPAAVVAADAEATATADAAAGVLVWLTVRQAGEGVLAEDLELITGCPVPGQVSTDRILAKRPALGEDPVWSRLALRCAAGALVRELLSRLTSAATLGICSLSQSASRPTNQSVNQSGDQSRRQSWSR